MLLSADFASNGGFEIIKRTLFYFEWLKCAKRIRILANNTRVVRRWRRTIIRNAARWRILAQIVPHDISLLARHRLRHAILFNVPFEARVTVPTGIEDITASGGATRCPLR